MSRRSKRKSKSGKDIPLAECLYRFGDELIHRMGPTRFADAISLTVELWNLGMSPREEWGENVFQLAAGTSARDMPKPLEQEDLYRWLESRGREFGADRRYVVDHSITPTPSGPSVSVRFVVEEDDDSASRSVSGFE